jgi:hypothetical protein
VSLEPTADVSVGMRTLRLIVVVLAVAQIALIALVGYDANRDRDADAERSRLTACRSAQLADFIETQWVTLGSSLNALIGEDEAMLAALVHEMQEITPVAERIKENC